jgi:hypothetical protein
MRYIQITWDDFNKDQEYWETISNEKHIAIHISSLMDQKLAEQIEDAKKFARLFKTPTVLGTP